MPAKTDPKALDPIIVQLLAQLLQVFGPLGLQLLLAWILSLSKSPAKISRLTDALLALTKD